MTKLTLAQVQAELRSHGFRTTSRAIKGGRAISLTLSKWSEEYAMESCRLAGELFKHAENVKTRVRKGRSAHPYDRGAPEFTPILMVMDG